MKEKYSFVYMLANKRNTTLYIGVTTSLKRRIYEHKIKEVKGFTSKYNLHKLVYYETFTSVKRAIVSEKQLKGWNRDWKEKLINKDNSEWNDLYDGLF